MFHSPPDGMEGEVITMDPTQVMEEVVQEDEMQVIQESVQEEVVSQELQPQQVSQYRISIDIS